MIDQKFVMTIQKVSFGFVHQVCQQFLGQIFRKVFGKSVACFCVRETTPMRFARAGWIRKSLIVNGSIYPCLRLSVKQPFVSRRLFCLWKLPGNKSWWRLYLAIMRSIFISLSLSGNNESKKINQIPLTSKHWWAFWSPRYWWVSKHFWNTQRQES